MSILSERLIYRSETTTEPVVTELPDVQIDYVAQEAMRLDRLTPDWHDRINTETLDLDCIFNCVLGQLYGSWSTGFFRMYDDANQRGEHFEGDVYCDSEPYRNDWLREINKRSNA